jgi:hypothetical protein
MVDGSFLVRGTPYIFDKYSGIREIRELIFANIRFENI